MPKELHVFVPGTKSYRPVSGSLTLIVQAAVLLGVQTGAGVGDAEGDGDGEATGVGDAVGAGQSGVIQQ